MSLGSKDGLQFNGDGYLKPTSHLGIADEIAGYKAQHGYEPSSVLGYRGVYQGINVEFIANIMDDNKQPVYPAIREAYLKFQQDLKRNQKKDKL